MSAFNTQLSNIQTVKGVNVLAMEVSESNPDPLRRVADKFREKYPKNGVAVLTSGETIISVVTEDLVKKGLKAGELITAVGGKGGGRPNMAQGSLSNGGADNALRKLAKVIEEKLK